MSSPWPPTSGATGQAEKFASSQSFNAPAGGGAAHSAGHGSGGRGSARWEAVYPFSETGRIVHNRIRAEFRFRDGKIIEHRDHFTAFYLGAFFHHHRFEPPCRSAL